MDTQISNKMTYSWDGIDSSNKDARFIDIMLCLGDEFFNPPGQSVRLPTPWNPVSCLVAGRKMRGKPYLVLPHFKEIKQRNGFWVCSFYFSTIVAQCFDTPLDSSTKLKEFLPLGGNGRDRPLAISLLTVLYQGEPPSKYQKLLPRQHFNSFAIQIMSGVLPQAIENAVLREL